jgi:hypothetical protein
MRTGDQAVVTAPPLHQAAEAEAAHLSPLRVMSAGLRVLPDFVIIGAQKCGTSSLYHYLTEHPTVAGAARKEVHFFDWHFSRGTQWYRAHFPTAAYRAAFRRLKGQDLTVGEASPYYLFHPHAPKRMRVLLPRVRLIALLRDPVERALSSYQHQVRRGRESLSFVEALERESAMLEQERQRVERDETYNSLVHRRFSYVARGLYADQLATWWGQFPREQMLVIRSEDFFAETTAVFQQVLAFLELDAWQPPSFKRFNAADYPDMESSLRARLVDYFAPHNQRLYELLGRDLGWAR